MGRSKQEILNAHIQTVVHYGLKTGKPDGPARIEAAVREVLAEKIDMWLKARFDTWELEDLLLYIEVLKDESAQAAKGKILKAPKNGKV